MTHETVKLANEALAIEVLKHGGPRVVTLTPADSGLNLLAAVPDAMADTEWGPYHFLGGHRLWHAPEALPRSYEPDDAGVTVTVNGLELLAEGPVEAHTGIRKSIRFVLDAKKAAIHVEHILENNGIWAVELGAWAITQMALGGVAVLPVRTPGIQEGLLADRQVAFWPYADIKDERFHAENDLFFIDGSSKSRAFKVGAYNPLGWVAYFLKPYLFIKRFEPLGREFDYADFGCNAEVYVKDAFIEVESQGPLTVLEPGDSEIHVEEWEVLTVKAETVIEALKEAGL